MVMAFIKECGNMIISVEKVSEKMTYTQIKWLILLLPTFSIGLWEYFRHTFLLPYLSMEVGNLLSPVIVFAITIVFLLKLFDKLEQIQQELNEEKAELSALQERTKISKELHDGIAQSLFFLSVKLNKLGKQADLDNNVHFIKMKKTLHHIHQDVRQAINNLRFPPVETNFNWTNTLLSHIKEMESEHSLNVDLNWHVNESLLSTKDKIELFACIKEALMNVVKHASTKQVWIDAQELEDGWFCLIKNKTNTTDSVTNPNGYGLQIVEDRVQAMNSRLDITIENGELRILITKEN